MLANALVAGINPVHVDAVSTYLMGQDPARPNYLRLAAERGFGTRDPAAVETYLMTDEGPHGAQIRATWDGWSCTSPGPVPRDGVLA